MAHRSDATDARDAEQAIERVLREEREAAAALDEARRDAATIVDAARDEGRAIVNRAMERVARWQAAHSLAVDRRSDALRREADRSNRARHAPDRGAIEAAAARLASRLTGPDADGDGDATR
jgi:hypothetical protein